MGQPRSPRGPPLFAAFSLPCRPQHALLRPPAPSHALARPLPCPVPRPHRARRWPQTLAEHDQLRAEMAAGRAFSGFVEAGDIAAFAPTYKFVPLPLGPSRRVVSLAATSFFSRNI